MANNSSELFKLANTIKKERGVSQKEAFALAKAELAKQAELAAAEVAEPTHKKRGNYVRDDAWKKNHAEKMRAAWARRKAENMAVKTAC